MGNRSTLHKIGFGVMLSVASAAAFFYLFVFPALVATGTIESSGGATAFAGFLYFQLWMLTTEYAYKSGASLYGFRRKHLWPLISNLSRRIDQRHQISGYGIAVTCLLSYLFMVYGFALAYAFISHFDPAAFNVNQLNLFSATYFSFVTAATVGYGDIIPISMAARLLVMVEISGSLVYAIFFFSMLASAIRDGGSRSRVLDHIMGHVNDVDDASVLGTKKAEGAEQSLGVGQSTTRCK